MIRYTRVQQVKDFITFPFRALTLFHEDRWGLSSLASERFRYVAGEVRGYCLDVGCGPHNRFVCEYLAGCGIGIDVFPYEGLSPENLIQDVRHFPFDDAVFDTVTFIASLNHVPGHLREPELAEAYRCLRPGGNVVVTMGHWLAELVIHKVVWISDRVLGTRHDLDTLRGMSVGEAYYLTDREIRSRLRAAEFQDIVRKRFPTQWGLNQLYIGEKPVR